jgi:2'-5' RNA ligase
VRLFVALDLPEDVRVRVTAWMGEPKSRDWRPVPPDQWHITLAFLGEVKDGSLMELQAALSTVAFQPFPLSLGPPGGFPNRHRAKAAWLSVLGDQNKLLRLQTAVAGACAPFAPGMDAKPFSGHVTLARCKSEHGGELPFRGTGPSAYWECRDFTLKKSVLGPEGSTYTDLARFQTKGG